MDNRWFAFKIKNAKIIKRLFKEKILKNVLFIAAIR